MPGKTNYLVGADPNKWRTDVPTYAKVKYEAVYPGVDLLFYGTARQLEYDFVIAPGADPESIRLEFQTPQAGSSLRIDFDGDLIVSTRTGEIRQHKPAIYQDLGGVRRTIPGGYVLKGKHLVGFQVGKYETDSPLVVDPVLVYSTYLGGGGDEEGHGVAVDSAGNAYVAGITTSTDFPTSGPLQPAKSASQDIFVSKINAAGTALIYSTYLGGSGYDHAGAIAVDATGNVYLTGFTDSTDFPIVRALQSAKNSSFDAFVAKLNASGTSLLYSTYIGGNGEDTGNGIAVDATGNAYVSGLTSSTNFPTFNPFQSSSGGSADAFVLKLSTAGMFVYSSYLGGSGADTASSIAVDSAGNAYLTGATASKNFPTVGALQPASGGGVDSFVVKVNSAGSALLYSTYLGGNGIDQGLSIALDADGNAWVAGNTSSTNFPTANPLQAANAGGIDAFVTKLNSAGSSLVYSTYLGGQGIDGATGVAVDSAGSAYVAGTTTSPNFPAAGSLQSINTGSSFDGFLAKLNPAGKALVYSTGLGGSSDDIAFALALDSTGNAYVVGQTASTNFPRVNPIRRVIGGTDAFIAKISPQSSDSQLALYFPRLFSDADQTAPDSRNTGIAVANLAESSAVLTLTAFDKNGDQISGSSLRNPASLFLNPGQQLPILATQIFGTGPLAQLPLGWLKLESNVRQVVGFFEVFNNRLSVLDGADVSSNTAASFIFPEIEDQGFTQFHVVNANNSPAIVTFELTKADGTLRLPALRRQIAASGTLAEFYHELLPGIRPFSSDYVRVTSNQPAVAFEYLGRTGQDFRALNGQAGGGKTLYCPQYVVGGGQYLSTLSIVNLDSTAGTVTLEFIGDNGTPIGTKQTLSIAAKGKVYISDQTFFLNAANSVAQGYIRISGSGVNLVGSVVFGDPSGTRFSSALPLVSTLLRFFVFSQVASNQTYFTGLAILNPGSATAAVTIEVYDTDGALVATKSESIAAGQRKSRLLTEYFPALAGQNRSSGYIKVSSDNPLAAFALFGANDLSVLSAVPPQVLP
ncbi:MAG TPA: SBBP repeat-containing protein [Acidobacteriota bacterium]